MNLSKQEKEMVKRWSDLIFSAGRRYRKRVEKADGCYPHFWTEYKADKELKDFLLKEVRKAKEKRDEKWRNFYKHRKWYKDMLKDFDNNWEAMEETVIKAETAWHRLLEKEVRKAEKRGREREAKKYGDFVVLMNEILLEENNPKLNKLKSLINNK